MSSTIYNVSFLFLFYFILTFIIILINSIHLTLHFLSPKNFVLFFWVTLPDHVSPSSLYLLYPGHIGLTILLWPFYSIGASNLLGHPLKLQPVIMLDSQNRLMPFAKSLTSSHPI